MNTLEDPSTTVEPQPVLSPARAACLPPTVTFELPDVTALPAGQGCPLWSAPSAGPAAIIRNAASAYRFTAGPSHVPEAEELERLARRARRLSHRLASRCRP